MERDGRLINQGGVVEAFNLEIPEGRERHSDVRIHNQSAHVRGFIIRRLHSIRC